MSTPRGPRQFVTTQWSLVVAAGADDASRSRARTALEQLCRSYWYPLYAFVRSRGHSVADSQDLTQAFFATIIETKGLASADPRRGRFRSYLLGAMKHFLANEWHRGRTRKRGGQVQFVEWDALDAEARYADDSVRETDPERLFDREWALGTVAEALRSLRQEMKQEGKTGLFETLKGSLTGEGDLPRGEIARRLEMTEGAVKVAIHRLRRRYRNHLRAAIARTVDNESDLDDEMRHLLESLRGR